MKTQQQQKLFALIEAFNDKKDGEGFQRLIEGMFQSPLLFPVGKGEQKGQMMVVQQKDGSMFSAFTDEEEAAKANLPMADFVPYGIEEYAKIIASSNVKGLVINMFNKKNCVINKEFFKDVVCPAFKEKNVMPGLKSLRTGEYIPITKMPFSIGRSREADLTIDEPTINEFHALLVERDNEYFVLDRNSVNGVYVNGQQLKKNEEHKIEFDDEIAFYEEEFAFVPMGIASRRQVKQSVYGDDRMMIVNGLFMMQNSILVQEFLNHTENFIEELEEVDTKKNFRKYFLIGLEMTCGMREKELNITDEKVIEEQRVMMLQKGVSIFQNGDYGCEKIERDGAKIYVFDFPKILHIPGLAKKMYLFKGEEGKKAVYAVKVEKEKTALYQVKIGEKDIECGEELEQKEQLDKIMELGAALDKGAEDTI